MNASRIALVTATVFTAGIGVHAWADDDSGWFAGRGIMGRMFHGEMMGRGMMEGWGHGMMMGSKFNEERLTALKAESKITDAQTQAWTDYTSAINDAAKTMRDFHGQMLQSSDPKTLPDRIALHQAMMSAGFATMKKVDDATLALYATLDADQKMKAGDLILGMGKM